MKKNFMVGSINDLKKLNDSSMILAVRSGKKIWVQNIETNPGVSVSRSSEDEIVIKVRLNDGQHLVIQDLAGMAEKRELLL